MLSLPAVPSLAQAREIQPGARIRFAGRGIGTTVTAMVLERRGDTLKVLQANVAPFEVRMSELTSLRLSQGKSRAAGAGVGALWGAGINFFSTIMFVAAGAECGDCNNDIDGPALGFSLISGAATGALVGVLIGKEKWGEVSLQSRASLHAVVGERRRLGVAMRLAL
jgi:hypothetical protein